MLDARELRIILSLCARRLKIRWIQRCFNKVFFYLACIKQSYSTEHAMQTRHSSTVSDSRSYEMLFNIMSPSQVSSFRPMHRSPRIIFRVMPAPPAVNMVGFTGREQLHPPRSCLHQYAHLCSMRPLHSVTAHRPRSRSASTARPPSCLSRALCPSPPAPLPPCPR